MSADQADLYVAGEKYALMLVDMDADPMLPTPIVLDGDAVNQTIAAWTEGQLVTLPQQRARTGEPVADAWRHIRADLIREIRTCQGTETNWK